MPFRLNRRQIISGMAALGALAGGSGAQRLRQAQKRVTVPEGDFAPLPIAIPNFVAGTPADGEVGVGVTQVITNNLKRSGLFAPIDQAAFIETHHQYRRRAAIPELEDHQRAGAGHRPHDAAERRPAEGGIPPLGRQHRAAARRPAIFHLAGILAAHRATSSPTRSTSASPARRAISTAASCSSTRPAPRNAASSGWR